MALTVTLYSISKRNNSTKIPDSTGRGMECALKSTVSMLHPILLINAAGIAENYAQFQNRYYFIRDVQSIRDNLWEIYLDVDVLATYKSTIISSTAYMLYSTTVYNVNLCDRRIPIQYTKSTSVTSQTMFSGIFSQIGRYMLSCVGEDGGIDTYILTAGQLNDLLQNIQEYQNNYNFDWPSKPAAGDDFLENIANFISYLGDCLQAVNQWVNLAVKSFLSFPNATDCIRSCFWMPFVPVTTASAEITLGGYHTGVTASRLATENYSERFELVIPWQFNDWRNAAPYTDLSIYIPFIGQISLPVSQMVGSSSITMRNTLSQKTGDIAVQIICADVTIGTYGGNCAISIPIGVSNINPVKQFNALVGVAAGVAGYAEASSARGAGAAIGGVLGQVEGALTPVSTSVGGIGSSAGAGLSMDITLASVCHNTGEGPSASAAIWGRPCYMGGQIPASGYVQTSGYSYNGACLEEERLMINQLLDGGVYID